MDRGAWQATVHRVAKSQTHDHVNSSLFEACSVGTKTSFASRSEGKSSSIFFFLIDFEFFWKYRPINLL